MWKWPSYDRHRCFTKRTTLFSMYLLVCYVLTFIHWAIFEEKKFCKIIFNNSSNLICNVCWWIILHNAPPPRSYSENGIKIIVLHLTVYVLLFSIRSLSEGATKYIWGTWSCNARLLNKETVLNNQNLNCLCQWPFTDLRLITLLVMFRVDCCTIVKGV